MTAKMLQLGLATTMTLTLASTGCLAADPDGSEDVSATTLRCADVSATTLRCARCDRLPDRITIADPVLRPEGIELDDQTILTGSMSFGGPFAVDHDGGVRPWTDRRDRRWWSDRELGTLGIHVDRARRRLLVTAIRRDVLTDALIAARTGAAIDPAVIARPGAQAGLAAYDLDTHRQIFFADLTPIRTGVVAFANDVTVDGSGTAYVTDSFGASIYRVATDGTARVFIAHPLLANPAFGPNGLDYDPSGQLVVGVSGAAGFVRVPIADPNQIAAVAWTTPFVIDGVLRTTTGRWITSGAIPAFDDQGRPDFAHFQPAVAEVKSDDQWATAQITARSLLDHAVTTVAACGDTILASMLDPNPLAPLEATELRVIELDAP